MKNFSFVVYFIVFVLATPTKTQRTLSIHQRVNLLKRELKEQIKNKQVALGESKPIESINEDYEYVDLAKKPITPIMNSDVRKKQEKYKLREIVTKPDSHSSYRSGNMKDTSPSAQHKDFGKKRHAAIRSKSNRKPKVSHVEPVDTFYRRTAFLTEDHDTPVEWIHCQDLITPFFAGFKSDISVTKRLNYNDHSVVRFIQLISLNTTGHTKEETLSILYQISNLQVRLFQWDVSAINLLLNVLTKDKPHTFRNVVYGVRALLNGWSLTISDTNQLLKESRIFRPPCVKISEYEGSTKTTRNVRYTKSTTAKGTCSEPGDEECY